MGGFLSGNRYGRSSKSTVEDSYTLDVALLLRDGRLRDGVCGSMTWSDGMSHQPLASVGYSVTVVDDDELILRLKYRVGDREDIDLPIRLQTTRPHFGGIRWWLTCPLMNGERPCERRVAKLHLRNRYFGCRQCLDLTYRSSQEAHQLERLFASMQKYSTIDQMLIGATKRLRGSR